MGELSPSVWFPVVTLIVGVLLKAIFDVLTESRKAAVDKAVRVEKRKEQLLMQRIESQRKILGDLQVAIAKLVRCASIGHTNDAEAYHETGEWAKGVLSDELNEDSRAAFRDVTMLKVRVSNDGLRALVSELSLLCSKIPFAKTLDASEHMLFAAGEKFTQVNELIGESLRALESDEQALLV